MKSPTHIIATDEAGYGPNLGPLVIGATRWTSSRDDFDPQTILTQFVHSQKRDLLRYEASSGEAGMMVADSKQVYKSGKIEMLERGVLASLYAIHGSIPKNIRQLLKMLAVAPKHVSGEAFFASKAIRLPLAADRGLVESLGTRLSETLAQHEASLDQLSAAMAFPQRFNLETEALGNKASFLTKESLTLIARQVAKLSANGATFDIRCDKHGGRNRYAPAIEQVFEDSQVLVDEESRPTSRYRFLDGRANICFVAKGESWLPIALASMVAKYLREIYMQCWNGFWQQHIPDLKPTKGYPVDAKRFKAEIESVQKKLGIADQSIWRTR